MFRKVKPNKTTIKVNESYIGETIEQKVNRIVNNKEAITDGAPLIYTDRKDGVRPEHDIRTDRFEVAIDAMDKVHKTNAAKREAKVVEMKKAEDDKKNPEKKGDTGGESTQGTKDSKPIN